MDKQRRVGRTAAELTFWTLCPYCYYAYEYEKAYEECCLRCANCKRGFHAAAIRAPPEATAFDRGSDEAEYNGVGGGGYYNCRLGLFPLKYDWGGMGKGEEEERIDVGDYLVEISSEEDEGWESEAKAGRVNAGNDEGAVTKRMEGVEEEREESWGGELEFEYEGDDILVSAWFLGGC